ncbi:MAG: metallophosphoesterase [Lachnospiraceae bacterium]|nr:metallophosphoesterase [Lachnospiraceae bacterium]
MDQKKLVIISDTHGDNRVIDQVIAKEEPFDYLIHCGDSETSLKRYFESPERFTFLAVQGNCDFRGGLPLIINERIMFYNVLITHGHHENVKYGNHDLLEIGERNRADIILFGHSHVPEIVNEGSILMINPGSPTYPHGGSRERTYAVLTLTDDYDRIAQIRVIP